ncbi:MAG: CoA transferase [Bacteroidia bacterium]|nr:CoA transferase [Bacteroidia bacterium]
MKLSDLRVLEFAGVLAGPSVGQFFAECGAAVTKVESPSGDITRSWRIPGEQTPKGTSAYYLSVNHGKKVVRINIGDPGKRKSLEKLVRSHDIVIVNFSRGTEKKYGLSPVHLHRMNPSAIIGRIAGYHDQPDRPAFDLVLQAESGMLSMNGTRTQPAKLPVAFIDLFAAHQLKEGILCALAEGKKGVLVSVSLMDAAMASLANQAGNYLLGGKMPLPQGMLHPNIAPYGETILTRDKKKLVLAVGTDKQFRDLCVLINCTSLLKDRRFTTNELRVKHRKALLLSLRRATSTFPSGFFQTAMRKGKLSAGLFRSVGEALDTLPAKSFLVWPGGKKIPKSLIFKIKQLV